MRSGRVGVVVLAALLGCDDAAGAPAVRDGGSDDASLADASSTDAAGSADAGGGRPDGGQAPDGGGGADAGRDGPPAPIVGEDYLDFGALAVPLNGVVRVELDVAANVRGLVLTADPGALPRRVSLLSLRGPDGIWLEHSSVGEPAGMGDPPRFDPASPASLADGLPYSFGIPSSPERPLLAGHYVIELHAADVAGATPGAADSGTLRVDAVLQTRAPATPGRLGLALWSASSAIELATLAQDRHLADLLAAAKRVFGDAQLDLELPAQLHALADPSDGFGTLDDDAELDALLDLLADSSGPEPVAHVILVDTIRSGPGKTVLAKTTGIPGAPAHPMLARRSAVVLALDALPADADRAGAMLAHELGHLLGLRHTTEADGERHDPIADTPECPAELASHILDGIEPLLSAEDCEAHGGTNLMFYTPSKSGMKQETLTEGQRWVLSRSPLLR